MWLICALKLRWITKSSSQWQVLYINDSSINSVQRSKWAGHPTNMTDHKWPYHSRRLALFFRSLFRDYSESALSERTPLIPSQNSGTGRCRCRSQRRPLLILCCFAIMLPSTANFRVLQMVSCRLWYYEWPFKCSVRSRYLTRFARYLLSKNIVLLWQPWFQWAMVLEVEFYSFRGHEPGWVLYCSGRWVQQCQLLCFKNGTKTCAWVSWWLPWLTRVSSSLCFVVGISGNQQPVDNNFRFQHVHRFQAEVR